MLEELVNLETRQEEVDRLVTDAQGRKVVDQIRYILPDLQVFGPGGGTLCPPCHVFAYIWANTRTSALKKLDFSQL